MTDWFKATADMQKAMMSAQKAQLDAAQQLIDQGRKVASAQNAGQAAIDANLKAWKAWTSLWG